MPRHWSPHCSGEPSRYSLAGKGFRIAAEVFPIISEIEQVVWRRNGRFLQCATLLHLVGAPPIYYGVISPRRNHPHTSDISFVLHTRITSLLPLSNLTFSPPRKLRTFQPPNQRKEPNASSTLPSRRPRTVSRRATRRKRWPQKAQSLDLNVQLHTSPRQHSYIRYDGGCCHRLVAFHSVPAQREEQRLLRVKKRSRCRGTFCAAMRMQVTVQSLIRPAAR